MSPHDQHLATARAPMPGSVGIVESPGGHDICLADVAVDHGLVVLRTEYVTEPTPDSDNDERDGSRDSLIVDLDPESARRLAALLVAAADAATTTGDGAR